MLEFSGKEHHLVRNQKQKWKPCASSPLVKAKSRSNHYPGPTRAGQVGLCSQKKGLVKPRWNVLECSSSKPGSFLLGWGKSVWDSSPSGGLREAQGLAGFLERRRIQGVSGGYRQKERWETNALLDVSTCFFIPHNQTSNEVRACVSPI